MEETKKELKEVKEVKEVEEVEVKEPDIFKTERQALTRAQEILEQYERQEIREEELVKEFARIVKDYKKLYKQMSTLVKINDMQHHQMNSLNSQLLIKNQTLQSLSHKLSRFLSPQVYDQIFEGKQNADITSERKKLTIFFSDIVNFTKITEQIQSEELTNLLNTYLNRMSSIALTHGGTIDKFIGDAVMVFFGAPESKGLKEDSLSCLSMAIEMRDQVAEMQEQLYDIGSPEPFQIRMGINTGYCTVGNFGSDIKIDYTIIGRQVNLANRLEQNANNNQILISQETHALVKEEIFCEKKRAIFVKGISYPIQTYQVVDFFDKIKNRKEIHNHSEGFSVYMDLDQIRREGKKKEILQFLKSSVEELEKLK